MRTTKFALIIEDDQNLASVFTAKLEQFNCEVEVAATAKEALVKIKQNYYNIIFVDIGLPDANGLNLVRQIRTINIQVPIIVITSHIELEAELQAFTSGANLFHPKPI